MHFVWFFSEITRQKNAAIQSETFQGRQELNKLYFLPWTRVEGKLSEDWLLLHKPQLSNADAKIKVPSIENPEQRNVLPWKPH